jgi:hypothetical protein
MPKSNAEIQLESALTNMQTIAELTGDIQVPIDKILTMVQTQALLSIAASLVEINRREHMRGLM